MYFSRDDETCLNEPETETLLIPTYELTPDAHGYINPVKQQQQQQQQLQQQKSTNTNGMVDLKISQVYQVIPCRLCNVTFASSSLRSKHEKREHMIYFKENKCFECNTVWNNETELIDHYNLNHSFKSNIVKSENKTLKNGFAYSTKEQSHEYLKDFAENLVLLRNNVPGAKKVTLKSFEYYNQCVQKIIDRNSMDSNTCIENVLDHLLEQNIIIKNSCHQCCISFKNVGEFKYHISKRYCKKRMRLVESGEMMPNQHFKCVQCDRIFGCPIILTQHIRLEHIVDKVPERCRTCNKYFQNKHEFNTHVQETCSYLIYCSICDQLFNTTDDFKMHCDEHKEIVIRLAKPEPHTIYNRKMKSQWNTQCCVCPRSFSYFTKLATHFQSCHPQHELITCQYCGDIFLTDIELDRHKQKVHYVESSDNHSKSQMHFCVDCNSVFRTVEELEQHKTIHSDTNSNINEFSDSSSTLTCTICTQTFNFEEELKRHIITKHKDGKIGQVRFRCLRCKKNFDRKESLNRHNAQKHKNPIIQHTTACPRCNKICKNVKALKYHLKNNVCLPHVKKQSAPKMLKIKTELVDGTYNSSYHECIVCKKMFISKRNLVSHARIHFAFKKMDGLPCQLCENVCETVEELLDHFKSHPIKLLNDFFSMQTASTSKETIKKEVDQAAFRCDTCKRSFPTKLGLGVHNYRMHVRKPVPNTTPTTRCASCSLDIFTTDELIVHVQEHLVRKHRFFCRVCHKSFQIEAFDIHMSKVHKMRFCVLCNKTFSSYFNLNAHKEKHFQPK